MDIKPQSRGISQNAPTLQEALERYVRREWPFQPASAMRRAWPGVTLNQAREVLRGAGSRSVIEHIARADDWAALTAIFGELAATPHWEWVREEQRRASERARHFGALERASSMGSRA